jgi:5'-methylthioadenosine phosphorylase
MITDYDCWHEDEDDVNGHAVMEVIQQNASTAQDVVRRIVRQLPVDRDCECATALSTALITDASRVPAATLDALRPIVGKYFNEDSED